MYYEKYVSLNLVIIILCLFINYFFLFVYIFLFHVIDSHLPLSPFITLDYWKGSALV
jgi:hypothetical protein